MVILRHRTVKRVIHFCGTFCPSSQSRSHIAAAQDSPRFGWSDQELASFEKRWTFHPYAGTMEPRRHLFRWDPVAAAHYDVLR